MKKPFPARLSLAILAVLMIGELSLASARSQIVDGQDSTHPSTITIHQPYCGGGAADEFLVEPKTYIRLRVDILEIEPSQTRPIASPSIRTENGKPAEILLGSKKESLSIQITPTILENKGIAIKIDFRKEPEMKSPRSEEAVVQNGESAVIALFENKDRKSKISLKITPLIEVVAPTKEYPGPVRDLRLDDSHLIKDDDKLIAHGNLSATSEQEDVSLWFIDDSGLFVLGFKRFEGAEPRGFVQGTVIKIKFGGSLYTWLSRNPILPEGKWLVWVLHNPPDFKSLTIKNGQGILGKNGMIGIGIGKDAWKQLVMKRRFLGNGERLQNTYHNSWSFQAPA